jgi:hypothetical protein
MKVPPIGWAFFGLAVTVGLIYLLNRGVYVGSTVRMHESRIHLQTQDIAKEYYDKYCYYLFWNDLREDWSTGSFDRHEAQNGFCSPLRVSQ